MAPSRERARDPRPRTTAELNLDADARAHGQAYLRYRDDQGDLRIALLDPEADQVYVGRGLENAVSLFWDVLVSGAHARLFHGGGEWSIADRGSKHGTKVAGLPLTSERRLRDGDEIELGDTVVSFHEPTASPRERTGSRDQPRLLHPSPGQLTVLIELARPYFEGKRAAHPPSNAEISERTRYSKTTVRDYVSALYRQAALDDDNTARREQLVQLAIDEGAVTVADYRS